MTIAELYAMWPSVADLARDLNTVYETVYAWRSRNSIPSYMLGPILRAAKRRGIPLCADDLIAMAEHTNRRRPVKHESDHGLH